jgi:hypothetical protein
MVQLYLNDKVFSLPYLFHLKWSLCSILKAFLNNLLKAIVIYCIFFYYSINIDCKYTMFSNLIRLSLLLKRDEEILNLFSSYLDHRDLYSKFLLYAIGNSSVEHLLAKCQKDAFLSKISEHGMRFTWTCFSVGKEATVVSFEHITQHFKPNLFEYLTLAIMGIYLFKMTLRM